MGVKNWSNQVTGSYTPKHRTVVTWEQLSEMFRRRYVPMVERETLAQEYMDLRQTTDMMTEITKMFTESALFCPEFTASEQT